MQVPIWTAAPLGLGMTLVSTFASDMIPQKYHGWLFGIGAALIVIGLVGGAIQIWWQHRPDPIDWDKWDSKDQVRWFEAVCLWENLEPRLPLPRKAKKRSDRLAKEIEAAPIQLIGKSILQTLQDAQQKVETGKSMDPDPNWMVNRSDLVKLAKRFNEEPKFLFPKKRL